MKKAISLRNITFSYPDKPHRIILNNVSVDIEKGKITGLLGPNGSGKTTLMNLIAGFLKPVHGEIVFEEQDAVVSMIFQESALLEWKTVEENIELSLLSIHPHKEDREKIVHSMLKLLHIESYKHSFPRQLSGGLKQRVAIARALARNPSILLMDEPFSALDVATKKELIKDIRSIVHKTKKSAIFITHNVQEAKTLCDSVIYLKSEQM